MTFAEERTRKQLASLSNLAPYLIASPPPSTRASSSNLAELSTASESLPSTQLARLRSTLLQFDPARQQKLIPIAKLAALLGTAFPAHSTTNVPHRRNEEEESLAVVLLGQFATNFHGLVLSQLVEAAVKLGMEDEYWRGIESSSLATGFYLAQTAPSRFVSLASTTVARLREITTHALASPTSPVSLSLLRTALSPSLLVTSLFPHLGTTSPLTDADLSSTRSDRFTKGTRKLLFLTMSPLVLTRQEVLERRKGIEMQREELAERIGKLTMLENGLTTLLSSRQLGGKDGFQHDDPIRLLQEGTTQLLQDLSEVLSTSQSSPPSPSSTLNSNQLATTLTRLLERDLPAYTASLAKSFALVRRPSLLTRSWIYLVVSPLVIYTLGRTVYNSRETLLSYAKGAKETVRGFLVDWVFEPVRKILETVRHSEGGDMRIMGTESLKSDLDSLERMVVDFGRDEYKMSEEELKLLANKVRVGDLTDVLRVWEKDIKRPIRSAVGGSLIRTLLIQVQKMKVDGALAMDGVEKMLNSQQLTFGFVGVTPSLLIVVGVWRWIRGFFRSDGSQKGGKAVRRNVWATMRHLDTILSPTSPADDSSLTLNQAQGFLLLELNSLRLYANSRFFPSKDSQLREAFLNDVRQLENTGTTADEPMKRILVERLWRWGTALGWQSIV